MSLFKASALDGCDVQTSISRPASPIQGILIGSGGNLTAFIPHSGILSTAYSPPALFPCTGIFSLSQLVRRENVSGK